MPKDLKLTGNSETDTIISFIGNPNVGKSSLFNALTGMKQHTGNWPGKTVAVAQGRYEHHGHIYSIIDLPGTYSLTACSEEEAIASEFICSGRSDCIVAVGDATCLERNLYLLFQILSVTTNVIFCVNLLDEAKRAGIRIDLNLLSQELGIPVVGTSAVSGQGLLQLKNAIEEVCLENAVPPANSPDISHKSDKFTEQILQEYADRAHKICQLVLSEHHEVALHRFDKIALNRWTGNVIMLALLLVVFWLTIQGANYPSAMLQQFFSFIKTTLISWTLAWPSWLSGILLNGIYETSAKVIAVMLPPMAIFFPLFSLLEDIGYLPRIAFMMDHKFERCGSCGKQCLTMVMGFGCNAAGVTGCRIIPSGRERMIAILTNSLVPCNGRFPALIALISLFFSDNSLIGACILTGFIVFSVFITFFASKFLSRSVLRGTDSHFILEIPPYRRPKIGQILIRAFLDRTLYVLGRAVVVAAPMGAVIWLLQYFKLDGIPLITYFSSWLDPFGRIFGMSGIVLAAFLLSFPANELLMPLLVMFAQGTLGVFEVEAVAVGDALFSMGWTWQTACIVILFLLFHWPCGTTCLTIYRETKSWKWTGAAILLPTVIGFLLCFLFSCIFRLMS